MYNFEFLTQNTLVVVPCYNAEKTISETIQDIKNVGFYYILVCDDFSTDNTLEVLKSIDRIKIISLPKNIGYGGNQKTLYNEAIKEGYQFVIMIHGDHQYNPLLTPALCWMLYSGGYDLVLGSRIVGGHPLKNGMPFYKYLFNRALTYFQNIITGHKLSEYHSGLRAYRTEALSKINFNDYSNDFIFDNQLILDFMKHQFKIGEMSCQTKFNSLTSSISFKNSVKYGLGIIKYSLLYIFKRSKQK